MDLEIGADYSFVQSGKPFFTPYRLGVIGIVVLSILVYLPCLGGLPVWDDKALLSGWGIGGGKTLAQCFENPFLGHYYRPFTSLSYFLDMRLFGPNPMLMHQTNILLHAAATVALIALVQALFARPKVALFAGLAFAIQPAQVGTVAWVGGRCDQLGALLAILFAMTLVRFHRTNHWGWILAGLVTFFSAMMVKEQFATLGLLVPLAAFAFRPKEEARRSALMTTIPFFLVGMSFVSLWVSNFPDPNTAAAFGAAEQISRLGRATVNYTLLLFAPNPWSMHTFSMDTLRNPVVIAAGLALFVGMFVGTYWLWRRDRTTAWIAAAALILFLPVSNLVPLPSLLAAPYRVGVVGPFVAILVAVFFATCWQRRRYVPAALLSLGVLAGIVLTPWGSTKWTSESKLFGTFVAYDPSAITLRTCYVNALEGEKRIDEALVESGRVMDDLFGPGTWRKPEAIVSRVANEKAALKYRLMSGDGFGRDLEREISTVMAMHGHLLRERDRPDEARAFLNASVKVYSTNSKAWTELAQDARERHDPVATLYFSRALASNPRDIVAASLLAKCYEQEGRRDRAYYVLKQVPMMKPQFGEPLLDLAQMQIERGKRDLARQTLEAAKKTIVDRGRLDGLWAKLGATVAFR